MRVFLLSAAPLKTMGAKMIKTNKEWLDGFNQGYLAGLETAKKRIDAEVEFAELKPITKVFFSGDVDGSV